MSADASIKETALAIQKQFEINHEDQEVIDSQYLKKLLADRLRELIDHEFDKFVNILYRIDIDEFKVKKILAEMSFDEAIEQIADLIIQRQMQKIITRKKYSQSGGDMSFDI